MRKLITLALLMLTFAILHGKDNAPLPVSVINFRGEELPVYAPPHSISPKRSVPPEYPDEERKNRVEGKALLMVLVGTDGKVLEAEILSSEPKPSFGNAAKASVVQWRYQPMIRNGKAAKFLVQVPIEFRYSEN